MRYKWTSGVSLDTCSRDFLCNITMSGVTQQKEWRPCTYWVLRMQVLRVRVLRVYYRRYKVGLETKLRIHDSCQEFLLFHKNTKPKYGACIYCGESDQEGLRVLISIEENQNLFLYIINVSITVVENVVWGRTAHVPGLKVRPWNATPSKSPRFCRKRFKSELK